MIKHIVFWKILKEGTDEDRQKAISQFRQKTEYLKTIIPEIQEATVGYNLNEGDVYHVCIDPFSAPWKNWMHISITRNI